MCPGRRHWQFDLVMRRSDQFLGATRIDAFMDTVPMTTQPQTVWEDADGVLSGSTASVRAAAMPLGDQMCGAVTLTIRVPEGFFEVVQQDGSGVATILLNPNEARGIAVWLDEAAQAAARVGPPLYES